MKLPSSQSGQEGIKIEQAFRHLGAGEIMQGGEIKAGAGSRNSRGICWGRKERDALSVRSLKLTEPDFGRGGWRGPIEARRY